MEQLPEDPPLMRCLSRKRWTLGKFVTTRFYPVAVVVGPHTSIATQVMLHTGEVVGTPFACLRELLPPTDVNCNVANGKCVIVIHGRLKGMFGRVIGSFASRLIVRNCHGSAPVKARRCTNIETFLFTVNCANVLKQCDGSHAAIKTLARKLFPLPTPLPIIPEESESSDDEEEDDSEIVSSNTQDDEQEEQDDDNDDGETCSCQGNCSVM
ncbi:uncharacterized protein LOC121589303 [Anopheles merus]|uniref:uncharacterized protein LOC121589303 n=1 Tax=Anopheles merus TaxID=30066 RepID=UPI001BE4A98E|nr:uncharacterized protein LOC121589303 [Anopheles merus]